MIKIEIPGRESLQLENLVLDLNGTIAVDGDVDLQLIDRLRELAKSLKPYIITAGTHGKLDQLKDALGIDIHKIEPAKEAEQKQTFIRDLGADKTVALGNGANDKLMLKDAAIGIAVIGVEGASIDTILSGDVVVRNAKDALDLLLKPKRLIATLRK